MSFTTVDGELPPVLGKKVFVATMPELGIEERYRLERQEMRKCYGPEDHERYSRIEAAERSRVERSTLGRVAGVVKLIGW